jgi:hypothetical protein
MQTLRTEDNFLINLDKVECFELHSTTDFYYEIRGHMNGFAYKVYTICYTIPEAKTEAECRKYANDVFRKFQDWVSDEFYVYDISCFKEYLFEDDDGNELYNWFCGQ